MRFDVLELLRFGPFSDRRIVLDAGDGPGLCIVYGPNEAGKSSALRALRAFLYEIPQRTSDDFVHPYSDLQVGARVHFRSGLRTDLVRRKGTRNTLRGDGPDAQQGIEALERLVRGIPESLFTHLYGLDHPALAAGAQALLDDRGEVGRTLFGAGLGIAHLRRVIDDLEREAAALFKFRGEKQKINQALAGWTRLQKQIRSEQLDPEKWEEQARLVERLGSELAALEREIEETAAHVLRTRRRLEASEAIDRARRAHAELKLEIEGDEQRLNALVRAPRILELADAIDELFSRLRSYQDAQGQLPRREEELVRIEAEVAACARVLGVDGGAGSGEPLARIAARETVLRSLAASADRHADRLEAAMTTEHTARVALAALASDSAPGSGIRGAGEGTRAEPGIADPEPLEQALRQAHRLGPIDAAIAKLRIEREGLVRDEELLRVRLGLEGRSQGELESLRIPSRSLVALHEQAFATHVQEGIRLQRQGADLDERRVRLENDLSSLRREGEVPDERELAATRAERDSLWRRLRRQLFEAPVSREAGPVPLDLADRFESVVLAADQLADRLRNEADRVARAAHLAGQAARIEREGEVQAQAEREHAEAGRALEQAWRAEWPAVLGVPGPPAVCAEWREAFERLIASFARRGRIERECADEEARRSQASAALAAALEPLAPGADERLEPLVDFADREHAHRVAARDRARERQRAREAAEGQLAHAVAEREQLAARFERWQAEWREALCGVGLNPALPPREVEDQAQRLPALLARCAEQRRRVDGMRSAVRAFEDDCARIAAAAIPELADRSATQATQRLKQALDQARHQATLAEELASRLAQTRERLAAVVRTLDVGAGERERIEADFDPAELEASLASLEARQAGLQRERAERSERLGEQRKALRDMDGHARISGLAEEAASQLASVPTDVRRYVELRLARRILEEEIEAYRRQNQGPILAQAGGYFASLTRLAYRGVLADEGDDGQVRLVGLRADGREIPVDGLSAGTRDQLFLALRLAAIAEAVARSEPMPLIADDILVDFDEDRSRAALEVLADFGAATQVLLFTHHRHVAEQAASLGAARARIVEL